MEIFLSVHNIQNADAAPEKAVIESCVSSVYVVLNKI